jgi:hypothetical protein
MPKLIASPSRIQAAGTKPKLIDEYVGRVATETDGVSIAHMRSPQGWVEPGQTPEFDEYTIVFKGMVRVAHRSGTLEVRGGQAVMVAKANGCSTARRSPKGPNTSRCACRLFQWRRFIATSGEAACGNNPKRERCGCEEPRPAPLSVLVVRASISLMINNGSRTIARGSWFFTMMIVAGEVGVGKSGKKETPAGRWLLGIHGWIPLR